MFELINIVGTEMVTKENGEQYLRIYNQPILLNSVENPYTAITNCIHEKENINEQVA